MVHSGNREEAVEIVDIHMRVRSRPFVHGLVVMDRVAGADELVRPAHVLEQLAIVLGASEGCEVWRDCLKRYASETAFHFTGEAHPARGKTDVGVARIEFVDERQ